jgi:hypothetical protein
MSQNFKPYSTLWTPIADAMAREVAGMTWTVRLALDAAGILVRLVTASAARKVLLGKVPRSELKTAVQSALLGMFPPARHATPAPRPRHCAPNCSCGRVALFTCNRQHVCRMCCADFLAKLNEPKGLRSSQPQGKDCA